MALTLADKKSIVADVNEVVVNSVSATVAQYTGLTVSEMTELRAKARETGVSLKVVRNTLAKRAVEGTDFDCMKDALTGHVILAFSKEEPSASARLMRDFAKDHEQLKVTALAIDGQLLDGKQLESIAKLPTRHEALGLLAGILKAPISQFVRTVAAPHAKFVRTVAAVAEQKKQNG